ncbi:PLP-dependent aminotransferase family protein [Abyssisolibacter fermentans]|uniref:aminotransferase-like domain-containing protein n=1 Tax=Abyssisolibacter fermentans TaxID=1766203 RepID=UPI00082C1D61|nr:PLP-dependent aminotransferase family protein [Abyssisolibacter fermentans]
MGFKYAKRMENIKASEIRELLKLTQRPEIISFAGGLPAPELFPVDDFRKVSDKVLAEKGRIALQYGPTEGYNPLREKIASRMTKVGVKADFNDILIISGSQQGLDFTGKIFLDKDDIVLCESPSYLGAINAFKAYQPKFIEVPTDDNGMKMNELEEIIINNDKIKFIYVIPDFQNPSGRTWSLERRKKLLELSEKYNIPIVEDNPYGELRYDGKIPPAIKGLDTKGNVIFLGTFSKIFSPGIRLGWVCASEEALNKYILVKQGADLQASTISQLQLNQYIEEYSLDEHVDKIKNIYRRRRDLMIDTMKKEFPQDVKFTIPEGGLFTWVELPEHVNTRELAKKAIDNNVAFVPGGSFYPNAGNENAFRLNYSNMDEERIVKGIKILAKVIEEALQCEKSM